MFLCRDNCIVYCIYEHIDYLCFESKLKYFGRWIGLKFPYKLDCAHLPNESGMEISKSSSMVERLGVDRPMLL